MTAIRLMAGHGMLHQGNHMSYRTMNMAKRSLMGAMGTAMPQRAFSLPDHLVMEMPNLSPTMEKVSQGLRTNFRPKDAAFGNFNK